MISFDKGNLEFVRDLHKVVTDLFFKENFNRVEWWCFADNPAVRGYKNFIKQFGGALVGELHSSAVFSDGTVHDTYIFEILRENVHNLY
jgi:RimJ/RimL family protein N-acetyltransferase